MLDNKKIEKFTSAHNLQPTDIDVSITQQDIFEIEGIVSLKSQGGYSKDDYTIHGFHLAYWKFSGEDTIYKDLYLSRIVERFTEYFGDVPKGVPVKLKVYLNADKTRGIFHEGYLIDLSESSLAEEAAELIKPIIVKTELFGELTFDKSIEFYKGKSVFCGKEVNLDFDYKNEDDLQRGLKTAAQLWEVQAEWKEKAEQMLVTEFLPTKNDSWLEEDEEEMTEAQFKAAINLETISFAEDEDISMWYSDGEIFWDHTLVASGTMSIGIEDVSMMG